MREYYCSLSGQRLVPFMIELEARLRTLGRETKEMQSIESRALQLSVGTLFGLDVSSV